MQHLLSDSGLRQWQLESGDMSFRPLVLLIATLAIVSCRQDVELVDTGHSAPAPDAGAQGDMPLDMDNPDQSPDVTGAPDADLDPPQPLDAVENPDILESDPDSADTTLDSDTHQVADVDPDAAVDPGGDVFEPSPSGCLSEVGPGSFHFACEGNITYDLEVPDHCVGGGCGLVCDVHGMTMDADQQDRNTRMRQRGREAGLLVIQPTAPGRAWSGARDDDHVWSFVQTTVQVYAVDQGRVYFTGFSQGADLALRMLCQHADELAAVAPLATNGLDCPQLPESQIPILHVHGVHDMLYNIGLGRSLQDRFLAHWPYQNEQLVVEEEDHRARRWSTPSGTPYVFWTHDFRAQSLVLGGHCFPGSTDHDIALPNQLFAYGCVGDDQFDVADAVIQFFLENQRSQ